MNGAILAAEIMGFLLQDDFSSEKESVFIDLVCSFYEGKGGDSPSKTDIGEATTIRKGYKKNPGK